jgi:hypothetical protein
MQSHRARRRNAGDSKEMNNPHPVALTLNLVTVSVPPASFATYGDSGQTGAQKTRIGCRCSPRDAGYRATSTSKALQDDWCGAGEKDFGVGCCNSQGKVTNFALRREA